MYNQFEWSDQLWFRHSSSVSIILCMAYTIVFILGIVGNCCVVIVVVQSPRMRTVTNFFIVNLAFADILVLIFCLPATLISNLLIPWIFGAIMCKAVAYLQGVVVSASINTLVAVSIDRFLSICHPLRCQMTRRCARYAIVCIWLYSSVIAIPWALYFTLQPIDPSAPDPMMLCLEQWPNEYSEKTYFIIANLFLCYLIPLFIITSCYIAIWMKVWRRSIPGETAKPLQIEYLLQRSKLKTAKMFVVIVIVFVISWLPLYCIFAVIKLGGPIESDSIHERLLMIMAPLAQWLGASNSCYNPMLYCFFNKKYRMGFLSLLKTRKCCCGRITTSANSMRGQNVSSRSNTRATINRITIKADTQCEFINNSLGIM
ncbi:neuropeptide SIFamide receptor-like [Oppia nitens]|uniref:neuropeptide SIFamide receptor-like n=1 Tax=Oppia nitens TaxID=1686743 RepID=UPI0023DA0543|nr:neuropeptide SIFamide receptor-like [Oppia nitens]